ncbi:MAG: hypothetical protein ACE5D1_06180, partial [Fidelibacterota bacterium]
QVFYWPPNIRYGLWLLGFNLIILLVILGMGSAAAIYLNRFPRYSRERLARRWGSLIFDRPDTVLNALQLEQRQAVSASPDLSRAYIHDVEVRMAGADPALIQNRESWQRWKRIAAGSVIFAALVLGFTWQSSGAAVYRWIHPRVNFPAPAPFALTNVTGDIHVLGGDPVNLNFRLSGVYPDSVFLELNSRSDDSGDSLAKNIRLVTQPSEDGNVQFQLTGIYKDYEYRARVPARHFWEAWDEVATPFHRIQVTDRPTIESLTFTIIPPLYSRLSPESQEGNLASIQGLKGSRVAVQLESNRILNSAELRFTSGIQKLNVRGRRANGEFILVSPDTVTLLLKDQRNITNADPIPYVIDLLPDQFPRIKVRSPEQQFDLGDNLFIPLELDLEDDFGFSDLQLVYAVHHPNLPELEPATSIFSVSGLETDRTTQRLRSLWDVNSINLMPEDEIHFHFELFDNDVISGPKKTASGEFVARLPSLADLFDSMESQEDDLVRNMDERLEEIQTLQEDLEKVELDLVKSEKVNWEQKQEIKKQLERFKAEAQALQKMAETLEKMAELDEKHNLFSDELRKKFDDLRNLITQLINDELLDKLNQLDQDLDSVKLDDLKQAMTELADNADRIEAELDRFLDLFKRVQAEQKMDEIARRLEALVREQSTLDKKIQESAEDLDPSDRARLKEDERQIRDEWKQTRTALEEGADLVREFSPETAAGLEAMQNSEAAEQAGENLQTTMDRLDEGQITPASRSSAQALQNLNDLNSQAQQLQSAFQSQTAEAMAAKFRSLMRDLLALSKSQEALLNATQSTASHSSRFRELAAQEQVLKDQLLQTMSKLMELSRETFAVTPEMGKALGMAAAQMEGAKQSLSERNR